MPCFARHDGLAVLDGPRGQVHVGTDAAHCHDESGGLAVGMRAAGFAPDGFGCNPRSVQFLANVRRDFELAYFERG